MHYAARLVAAFLIVLVPSIAVHRWQIDGAPRLNASVYLTDLVSLSASRSIAAGVRAGALRAAQEPLPSQTPVFVLRTEADAKQMAKLHATPEKQIMFTTVSFKHKNGYHPEMGEFAAHLWQCLKQVGRLQSTVLLTHHLQTCQAITELGIPCFLDRWSLQPSQLPGQYRRDVPHYYLKFSWALLFLKWGYTALFIEMDQAFLADPLPHLNGKQYDLEDLSDWRQAEIPGPKERALETCPHYHMVKLDEEAAGDHSMTESHNTVGQRLEWGPSNASEAHHTKHINPCGSTGFWAAHPVPATVRWLTDFIDMALYTQNEQIEQQVWNQMIGAYLYSTPGFPALRLGLLDDSKFMNTEVYVWRQEQNLTLDPVMLHAANRQGSQEKKDDLQGLGLWMADIWQPKAAQKHVQKLLVHFRRSLPWHRF